jgi:hypothetical protein
VFTSAERARSVRAGELRTGVNHVPTYAGPGHPMWLIGEKFVTYRMAVEGDISIVKMEDYPVPGRENPRIYREFLAFRLAARIGLPVPPTRLRQDPRYGRVSVQQYVHRATKPDPLWLERMATSTLGMRIALFDLVCGNHDRKPDNLLQLGTAIIPIDFNTAFQHTTTGGDFDGEADIMLARWFRIRGILSLTPAHRAWLLGEAKQMSERLDDAFIRACLAEIPTPFCDPVEAAHVQAFLGARRDRLHASISTWWDNTVAPLHGFDGEALAMVIREHMR